MKKCLLAMALCMIPLGSVEIAAQTPMIMTEEDNAVMVYGTPSIEENQIFLKNSNEAATYSEIILNITDTTRILDAVTLEEKTLTDINEKEIIYAYTSPVMTRSLPPISNAEYILINIPADFGIPSYEDIQENLNVGTANGTIEVLNDERVYITNKDPNGIGDIILNVSSKTKIYDVQNKNLISVNDIKKNEKVYAYTANFMTLSLPPISNAEIILTNLPKDYRLPLYTDIKQEIIQNDEFTTTIGTYGKMEYDMIRLNDGDQLKMYLKANDSTLFLDASTYKEISLKQVEEGSKMVAYIPKIMLMIYPPQTTPIVVLCNVNKDAEIEPYSTVMKLYQQTKQENTNQDK